MFKKITIMLMLALLVTTAGARDYGMTYHEIQIVDELGRPVTNITDLYIYNAGGATNAVIYMDRNRQKVITIPMLEGGLNNSTLVDGYCYWWGPDGYNFSVTNDDAVGPMTNAGHIPRTGSETALIFPSYLRAISAVNILDGFTLDFGDGPEWEIAGGAPMDETLRFVPTGDNYTFIVGSTTIGFTSSFHVPINATEGLIIDATTGTFTWDGGAVLLNNDSADDVGICTGTSTGNVNIATGAASGDVTIGNGAAGTISLDTTENIVINADTTITITNDTGDQTYTATDGSVTIIATEDSPETFHLHVAGGPTSSIFIVNETGTAASAAAQFDAAIQLKAILGGIGLYSGLNNVDAIRIEANGGTAATINIHNNQGTAHALGVASIHLLSDDGAIVLTATTETAAGPGESAIQLTAPAGAIELLSSLNATGAIKLTANGGAAADIDIWNDTGDTVDSIHIVSDLGGLDIDIAGGATMDIAAAIDGSGGFKVITNVPTGQSLYGGFYSDTHIEGTTNGTVTAIRGKISMDENSIPGTYVQGARITVEDSGADLSGARVVALLLETRLDDAGANPEAVYMMRFNCIESGETPDAWFQAANLKAIAGSTNHYEDGSKVGSIKCAIVGIGDCYLWLYDSTGG